MKTLRRLIYGEILIAVLFVLLAFLALFSFFDLVDELPTLGRASPLDPTRVYALPQALAYVALQLPTRIYELLPIAVLIGSVFVLVRLAQSSEFTILRTSGLGPGRALRTLLGLGAGFVLLTFAIGDYVAPAAGKTGQLLKSHYQGRTTLGRTGAWLKERSEDSQFSVNVGALGADGALQEVRIFEFGDDGRLRSTLKAATGQIASSGGSGTGGHWQLQQVQRQQFDTRGGQANVQRQTLAQWDWPTGLSSEMVSVALLKPERMATLDLFRYVRHLEANGQNAQRYEIEFWRKLFYPLSCLVMVVLALPFAYLHFRSGGVAGYVFLGVMLGISFFLLSNVFGYIGNLRAWAPWLVAAAPSLLYSLVSLGAFGWLVLRH
ncbi:LPS export ABC transporter permease LptG [Malikia spinosa]|uniref:LPS export ABC transporter permease LptG n=1 Tax=Malikia spinosa TaxID=86180 RepID=A0A2S9KC88_9BURK|nr:LPS export ABC transporter permease LptG [Malikia spinosa]PRD68069.1 LPS export ABC transporter permease LptG [Malikia spinosa]